MLTRFGELGLTNVFNMSICVSFYFIFHFPSTSVISHGSFQLKMTVTSLHFILLSDTSTLSYHRLERRKKSDQKPHRYIRYINKATQFLTTRSVIRHGNPQPDRASCYIQQNVSDNKGSVWVIHLFHQNSSALWEGTETGLITIK